MTREVRLTTLIAILVAMAVAIPCAAFAQTCAGVFIRNSQSYDDGNTPQSVVTVPVIVPKGTRDTIVGYIILGGKKYYVQYRAYYHDPADIRLSKGCVLQKYPG
jgi:hypothetical protein